MTYRRQRIVALGYVLLASACVAPGSAVRVDQSEGGLPDCSTFGWLASESQPASLTEQRVREAVFAELQRKGYAIEGEKPQCRITYLLATHERPEAKPRVGVGAGGGSGGFGGGIGISIPVGKRKEQAGTFTLDVIDAEKNAQVWSGEIDAEFEAAELSVDEAHAVVQEVLSRFPDRR